MSVAPAVCSPVMGFDVVIVGGGTAGCVLAARLSESPARSVCLLEAGPDYGPLDGGRWPADLLDARAMPETDTWAGAEDGRTLGGRVVGGSSAANACAILEGSPADYDEWGQEWSFERLRPSLDRARTELRTAPANTDRPAPLHRAFLESAREAGFPLLSDPNDAEQPVGVAPYPANVVDGVRWNAAFAYLDPVRARPNLTIADRVLVDRVLFDGPRTRGVVSADGHRFEAETVILAGGAYFSAATLMRSGIGPEAALRRLGIAVVQPLPVGERLLDHCGVDVAWRGSERLDDETAVHARDAGLFSAHVVLKAASRHCAPGTWDLHLMTWTSPAAETPGRFDAVALVFHMKPLSNGRVVLRSTDPSDLPIVERGFLAQEEDVETILDGIEIARRIADTEPLRGFLAEELHPGEDDPVAHVRATTRTYFHPAGTCPLGRVVDVHGRVLGVEGLYVADASVMPTIPRANTNLTTAALAEHLARGFS